MFFQSKKCPWIRVPGDLDHDNADNTLPMTRFQVKFTIKNQIRHSEMIFGN